MTILRKDYRDSIGHDAENHNQGVIILTGPSSCGKGAVSELIGLAMNIPNECRLSMGQILRDTYSKTNTDSDYAESLHTKYNISKTQSVLTSIDATNKLEEKIASNAGALQIMLDQKYSHKVRRDNDWRTVSQLDWLEFCTTRGLLIPDRWTEVIIKDYLEANISRSRNMFLLDGYPRTTNAAEHLLDSLDKINVPVLKVFHLSISMEEMVKRAMLRKRVDDTPDALKARFEFYTNQILPSVDYMKERLGLDKVALINAHQPYYDANGNFDLRNSIAKVASDCLVGFGLSKSLSDELLQFRPAIIQKQDFKPEII